MAFIKALKSKIQNLSNYIIYILLEFEKILIRKRKHKHNMQS